MNRQGTIKSLVSKPAANIRKMKVDNKRDLAKKLGMQNVEKKKAPELTSNITKLRTQYIRLAKEVKTKPMANMIAKARNNARLSKRKMIEKRVVSGFRSHRAAPKVTRPTPRSKIPRQAVPPRDPTAPPARLTNLLELLKRKPKPPPKRKVVNRHVKAGGLKRVRTAVEKKKRGVAAARKVVNRSKKSGGLKKIYNKRRAAAAKPRDKSRVEKLVAAAEARIMKGIM